MIIQAVLDGVKTFTSAKGNIYADLFIRGLDETGSPTFEQVKLRTFNQDVISKCQKVAKNDLIGVDISIRDATVEEVFLDA